VSELAIRDDELLAEVEATPELAIPLTGELIDRRKPAEVARGLLELREAMRNLHDLRAHLEELLLAESRRQGTKTLRLGDLVATVSGGPTVAYEELEELRAELQAAGLGERANEIVVEEVRYRVDQRRAKQAESANTAYADILARHRHHVDTAWRVAIKRPR
jgi:hypothetical protein